MGTYLNPGNSGFEAILRSEYVDKTGLIAIVNSLIGTKKNLVCLSRPRRFGKSYAAQMLSAYYGKTCDSDKLFAPYAVAKSESYRQHLNKYDVIYWDMTYAKQFSKDYTELPQYLSAKTTEEIVRAYPTIEPDNELPTTLIRAAEYTGNKFIFIIDEWDAPIRENPKVERNYLEFLRTLFKSSGTTSQIVAAAYMTGILPIRKDGSQSAISDFREYTMLEPKIFATFFGFTEDEVQFLCERHSVDYIAMKRWYDGYNLKNIGSIYNPNSVMKAIEKDNFKSYWTETSAASSLMHYISQDYNGLTKTIAELIGGINVKIDPEGFANNLTTFRGKDDVLTLLVHLGYLSFDEDKETVRIPNEEIKREFGRAVRNVEHPATMKRLAASEQLFLDTIEGKEEAVAAQIEQIHKEETSPLHYNNEASLRSVIKLAYYAYKENYEQFEELPTGVGYADVVYIPKPESLWPPLIIELKWNKSAQTALDQIKNREYPSKLKDFGKEIVLVGVNYDKNASTGKSKHECKIERVQVR